MRRILLPVLLLSAAPAAAQQSMTLDEYARNLYQCVRLAKCVDDECRAETFCDPDKLADLDRNFLYTDVHAARLLRDDPHSVNDITQQRMVGLLQNPPLNIVISDLPEEPAQSDGTTPYVLPPMTVVIPPIVPGQGVLPFSHQPTPPAPVLDTSPGIPVPTNDVGGIHTDGYIPSAPAQTIVGQPTTPAFIPPPRPLPPPPPQAPGVHQEAVPAPVIRSADAPVAPPVVPPIQAPTAASTVPSGIRRATPAPVTAPVIQLQPLLDAQPPAVEFRPVRRAPAIEEPPPKLPVPTQRADPRPAQPPAAPRQAAPQQPTPRDPKLRREIKPEDGTLAPK